MKEAREDFDSCVFWGSVGAVGGGLVGFLGGPWGAAAGATLVGSIAAANCADNLATDMKRDLETFCKCWDDNDCGDIPDDLGFKCPEENPGRNRRALFKL